jgi:hypothetical protein
VNLHTIKGGRETDGESHVVFIDAMRQGHQ